MKIEQSSRCVIPCIADETSSSKLCSLPADRKDGVERSRPKSDVPQPSTGVAKLKIKEMGSRYLFICLYISLEKHLSRGDYKRE